MSSKANVLLTGAAGFIGSHLTDELVGRGYNVVALDDLSGGFAESVNRKAHFVKGSVTDEDLIGELFEKWKFHYVFHFGAYAAEGLSHFIRRFNYENNLVGSVNLINAAVNHGVKCFVFASSIAVYGPNQLPMVEDLTPEPEDPYGISKYAVELDLAAARRMFGLDFIIFRPHNVYGERQNIGDKYRNVVGIFMNNILKNKPLPIFGDGEQTRAFSYIGDVAPLIAGAIERPEAYNEVFNVGADQPYSVNQLAREVCRAMSVDFQPQYLAERLEVKNAYASHDKVLRIFGYTPRYSLEEGIARMAAWVKNTGSRASSKFENIEIERGLPPSWRE